MNPALPAIKVPFHRPSLGEEEIEAVSEVLRSGWLTTGARTLEFEQHFADYVGARHAIAVSSCTAALHLSLEAIGLEPGDEVLVPTTTFTATAEAVRYLGARPVLVDIDPRTMNIDPHDAARKLTPRTRAIIPVHFAGLPCDMTELSHLAALHGLHVIEDAAHALPSMYKNRRVGSISELTAFSFYATKPVTTGEGGMVTTDDAAHAAHLRMMRHHGVEHGLNQSMGHSWDYQVTHAGFKYNLTDLQSAIGIVQLARCDEMYRARQRVARRYNDAFASQVALGIPEDCADRESSWHLYVLKLDLERLRINRNRFIDELENRGVSASVHFIPLHLHPFYQRTFGYRVGDFPEAETQFKRCVSLPIYPGMSDEEVAHVVESVTDIADQWKR